MQALARAARGFRLPPAGAAPAAASGGYHGKVQPARGVVVWVRDGNLERALAIMERKMRQSGMERLIRRTTVHHVKDSEKRVLAHKALIQRIRSQGINKIIREMIMKKMRPEAPTPFGPGAPTPFGPGAYTPFRQGAPTPFRGQ